MDWDEIMIKTSAADAELAAGVAHMTVPYGIYIEDYSDMDETLPQIGRVDAVDEELLARDRGTAVIHVYIPKNQHPAEAVDFIRTQLTAGGIRHEIAARTVRETDWENSWKQYYKPLRIGRHLVVRPTWELYTPLEGDVVIDIDPGSAFGTGGHETTRLCLELLEEVVTPAARVLDMGCGSGILSIAALKLGAQHATAVDIDKNAAETAARNAAENGFERGAFRALWGDVSKDIALSSKIRGWYGIIVANIVADVILSMGELFYERLRPGGKLVVSGIIEARAAEVQEELTKQGFTPHSTREQNGWVAAVLSKPE